MSQQKIKDSFREYFSELLGQEEAEKFFNALTQSRGKRTVRVNTLRTTFEDLKNWLSSNGYNVSVNKYSKSGVDIEGEGKPLSLKLPYIAGHTYPQDSSSMFAVELLDPKPHETILDLTAAPGGKTTHIAQKMQNTGIIISNDMDTSRLKASHSNLERLGIWNTVVTRMMPHKMAEMYPETFDKILLDPSCSGEGILQKKGGKASFWSLKAAKRFSSDQYGMLKSAFKMLKPGGRIVYSTCTLNKFEDDAVVERLLEEFPQAKVEKIKLESTPKQLKDLLGYRFWPQITGTKGFFCIAITKKESLNLYTENQPSERVETLNKSQLKKFEDYLNEQFGINLPDAEFSIRDQNLFILSKEIKGFKFPRSYSLSFPLLKVYNTEIKPSHPGALFLAGLAKKNAIQLNREQLEKMVEKHSCEVSEKDGAYLVKFENFGIGFGKVINGILEVNFPKQY